MLNAHKPIVVLYIHTRFYMIFNMIILKVHSSPFFLRIEFFTVLENFELRFFFEKLRFDYFSSVFF